MNKLYITPKLQKQQTYNIPFAIIAHNIPTLAEKELRELLKDPRWKILLVKTQEFIS
uniref:Uncharacterized protein n=1 Tax=Megaviridae environmental sample TaxID=1737588 RepID=A0A5J6VIK0_9VIRU|nr:MAG: hypothetical protein [Megaviridae environmental sample]